ncbi:Peptidase C39 family protein [uncultured archaeon]|nr:Peptidase C39 family protein [uncultured archaeon]
MTHNLKIIPQEQDDSCGPAALRMILATYGTNVSEKTLRKRCRLNSIGTSGENIVRAAQSYGYQSFLKDNCSWNDLKIEIKKNPVIIDWFSNGSGHYSVGIEVYGSNERLVIADPEYGVTREMFRPDFMAVWFDYKGLFPKTPLDMILRRMIVVQNQDIKTKSLDERI